MDNARFVLRDVLGGEPAFVNSSDSSELGRTGRMQPLNTPFANGHGMTSVTSGAQAGSPASSARPCTRAQSGAATAQVTSYMQLDRGLPQSGSIDSGSGGDNLSGGFPIKEKKKVGRPISFKGDINSKELTESERRRIKRRIANRESARRVRQKRQETMEEMQARMDAMQQQTAALTSHLQEVENQKAMLLQQLTSMRGKWSVAVNENMRLQEEVTSTRLPPVGTFETLSSPSDCTHVDMGPSPPQLGTAHNGLLPASMAMAAMAPGSGAGSAVTSGQNANDLSVPSCGSVTQMSTAFRPGVTITSVQGFGAAGDGHTAAGPSRSPPPRSLTQQPPPMSVHLKPASGNMFLQQSTQARQQAPVQPCAPAPMPHHGCHVAADRAGSIKDALDWFLRQTSLEPLPSLGVDAGVWDPLRVA